MTVRSREIEPTLPPVEAWQQNYSMGKTESVRIDTIESPFSTAEESLDQVGIYAPGVVGIKAGSHDFLLLDVSKLPHWDADFILIDENPDVSRAPRLSFGQTITVGRHYNNDYFTLPKTVSGRHFSIKYDSQGLSIENLIPTNDTTLVGNIVGDRKTQSAADFTHRVVEKLAGEHHYGDKDTFAPYGYYKNHPIIGRNSVTVKNGVYFTRNPDSEAVVVDNKSSALQQLTDLLTYDMQRQINDDPTVHAVSLYKEVLKRTKQALSYDLQKSDNLSAPYYNGNQLISLSEYVQAGVGVCRHQCLLAALLLETLVEQDFIRGTVAVERNRNSSGSAAHAWAVLKQHDGTTIVIDPTNDYVGTKERAKVLGMWQYSLPTDN